MKAGGRWNNPGEPAIYGASTLSLACLEILVHLRKTSLVPPDYVYCTIDVPNVTIRKGQYGRFIGESLSRVFGSGFLHETACKRSDRLRKAWEHRNVFRMMDCVLEVPSAVIPTEHSYVINPQAWNYKWLKWSEPKPFEIDPRLLRSEQFAE